MTHPDPDRSDPPAPKRTARFNGVVVLLVLLLFVVAGVYVWTQWSADDDSAADEAAGPVQPAVLPDPADGAVRAQPGAVPPGVDPSGDAVARGVERAHVPKGAEAPR